MASKRRKAKARIPSHDLADAPRHAFSCLLADEESFYPESSIHIFFDDELRHSRDSSPVGAPYHVPTEEDLVCKMCGHNSRPKTPEMTDKTQFICSDCEPIGIACGAELDRSQFDNWTTAEKWRMAPHDRRTLLGEFADLFIARTHMTDQRLEERTGKQFSETRMIADAPSVRIIERRQLGEAWAVNATPRNIARLGKRERECLVAFFWAGLTWPEISDILSISQAAVHKTIQRAQNKLSKVTI
jgi:predicted DNA-binding protein (UPF0251 family)